MLDRQAVFLQGHGRETLLGNAARANVGAGLAARSLDPEAGDGLQRVGDAGGIAHAQRLFADRGHRIAGVEARAAIDPRARRDDDVLDRGGRICGLGEGRLGQNAGRAERQETGAEAHCGFSRHGVAIPSWRSPTSAYRCQTRGAGENAKSAGSSFYVSAPGPIRRCPDDP